MPAMSAVKLVKYDESAGPETHQDPKRIKDVLQESGDRANRAPSFMLLSR